jgi:Polyketide cyclase / dehydrase and lipid transport
MVHEACESIAIAADAPSIMAIIADFPAYPQWAGYIKQADVLRTGPTGRAERVHFVLDAGVMRDDYVLEYDWGGNDWVHWALVEGRALKYQDGVYRLQEQGDGITLVTYELSIELVIPMLGLFKRKAEKVIMDTALKGLKRRAEGAAPAADPRGPIS